MAGVIREVKEETGLYVKVERLSGVYYKPERNEIIFSFICEILSGEITLTDEADQIKYFDIDNFPKNVSHKQMERAKDSVLKKEKTILKIQNTKNN